MKLSEVAALLAQGERVEFRPSGHSMEPQIKHRELVCVEPLGERLPAKGDVVLAKVKGRHVLHLVGSINGDLFRIENRRGRVNGWVGRQHIFGCLCGRDGDTEV